MLNKRSCSPIGCFLLIVMLSPMSLLADQGAPTNSESSQLVDDDYTSQKHPVRNAARGDWKVADGKASVQQEDELYKKYKNHGPIMIYEIPHADAKAVFDFKPTDCKMVVFTMDAADGGHAFRVRMRTEGKTAVGPPSQIVTYAAKQPSQDHAEMIVLSSEGVPKLKNNEWNRIEVTVVGENATVKIGDKSIDVHHERIAQKKKVAKLGFSFGALSIRKFNLEAK